MNPRVTAWTGSLLLHGVLLGGIVLLATQAPKPLEVEIFVFDLAAPAPPQTRAVREVPTHGRPATASPVTRSRPAPPPRPQPQQQAQQAVLPAPSPASRPATPPSAPPARAAKGAADDTQRQPRLRERYLSAQFGYIRERIFARLDYPAAARRRAWQGQVRLCFTILESGEIRELEVTHSSGHVLLDRQALAAVAAAAPFPPPPCPAEIRLPVTFALQE